MVEKSERTVAIATDGVVVLVEKGKVLRSIVLVHLDSCVPVANSILLKEAADSLPILYVAPHLLYVCFLLTVALSLVAKEVAHVLTHFDEKH